ncbi:tRNA lysidine(34) synthetase TilS [Chlorobium phaeovibrioides]|uniref:tRNA(Ile)-lysidine synthase n=2 Tax=Chlorobium phaeovibrioides TaxID=1094 RepID=A0A432AWP7_CHLPH|nr:tRNA lysidine(34) synthetase TilS [Chlorobium phaeovibrioides]HCD36092.1 tRNA lysidine(34) synthetase TilS [Chlorobium sp.]KAA6233026.1 tRNA lysidine(34) synthetase TilS [Chlorobium phaeovibrioides]MWV53602.1 tRNA lysidine(34) synthetase TilS [Chlorobium phaeovibrioides]RTY35879.1 tRNA lysidine(34) synthetase TilS [Chlorobium phaeovibrioides]RTY39191.1 tRNA lysidine(34) synthetase TilS [Chlorobium phaeovibrioides]
MNRLEKQFLEQIRVRRLVMDGEPLLVAVSGGPDSMALLSLFLAVQPVLHCRLGVAHCNFGLRGPDSLADEAFVREACRRLGLECFVARFDTELYCREHRLSIEESARTLRYDYFGRLMKSEGFTKVATGHHVADNAETILFNLFRGTSQPSLRGIRSRHGSIIRPMLLLHKADILGYLREKGMRYRIDRSNESDSHDRNFIRNRVIPLLLERFPDKLMPSLQRLSEQSGELEEFLESAMDGLIEREPGLQPAQGWLDVAALKTLTVFEQKEVLKRALREHGYSVDAVLLQRLVDLLTTQPGRRVMLEGGGEVVWKDRRLCFLSALPSGA